MRLQNYLRSFLLVLVVVTAQLIVAQTTIQGHVMDKKLKEPLTGAAILIEGTTNGTTAVTDYSTLPEGIWSGDVSVQFDATWTS